MNLIMKIFLFFTFITSVFSFKPTGFIRNKVRLQMSDDFYGTPWSYNELIENINNHNIEKINFLTDSNSVVSLEKVVDNQYKIHTTKLLPNLYEKIVPVLEKNHINYVSNLTPKILAMYSPSKSENLIRLVQERQRSFTDRKQFRNITRFARMLT